MDAAGTLTLLGVLTASGGIKLNSSYTPPNTTFLGNLTIANVMMTVVLTSGTMSYPNGVQILASKGVYLAYTHVTFAATGSAVTISQVRLYLSGDAVATTHCVDNANAGGGEYYTYTPMTIPVNSYTSTCVTRIVQVTHASGQYLKMGINATLTGGMLSVQTNRSGVYAVRIA